jgi:hypothetical protein
VAVFAVPYDGAKRDPGYSRFFRKFAQGGMFDGLSGLAAAAGRCPARAFRAGQLGAAVVEKKDPLLR